MWPFNSEFNSSFTTCIIQYNGIKINIVNNTFVRIFSSGTCEFKFQVISAFRDCIRNINCIRLSSIISFYGCITNNMFGTIRIDKNQGPIEVFTCFGIDINTYIESGFEVHQRALDIWISCPC